ncbi:MAG TPA: putative metal-binding motif-containing protein [Polyangiaceae bacterium]|nr:putative metal-binding motif-containing protein [Polyangiaceae bacterium]
MFLKFPGSVRAASVFFAVFALSCGARTSIYLSDAGVEEPVLCATDLDCDTGDACARAECREGSCVPLPAIVCDDHDACTADLCDAQSGQCSFTPVTLDLDADGHRSPKPGFAPGAPGACGDDCDDRSASAHPGGSEACDGVDNDCNGKIDDGALYGNLSAPVRVSSKPFEQTSGGGIAFDGKNFGISFSGHEQHWSSYFTSIARDGGTVVPNISLSKINSDTYAESLFHNGSYFARAWSDARQARNYEVYFNRYNSLGQKLGPDLRVSQAPDFSLNPVLAWNGSESLLVWDDRRNEQERGEDIRLFGQRIALDGSLIGENIALTGAGKLAEYPAVALSKTRVGIAFVSRTVTPMLTLTHANFFTTAADLTQPSALVDLGGTNVLRPSLVYVAGRFAIFWGQNDGNYGPSIHGAVVDESGSVLRAERAVTSGASHARSFSALSLGDRVVLVWADDHDGSYQLYLQILDADLNVLSPRTRLTFTGAHTVSPVAALGPNGDLGVLYDDWQSGVPQAYFLAMSCAMSGRISPDN